MKRECDNQIDGLRRYVESRRFLTPYGCQWGNPMTTPSLRRVLDLARSLCDDKDVLEIGAGGGRWSSLLWPTARSLVCVDGTPSSEIAICEAFDVPPNVAFRVAPDGKLPTVPRECKDVVFTFDTFVHFDLDLFEAYVNEVGRILRPGGVFVLHHAFDQGHRAEFFRYYEAGEVTNMLARAGMVEFGETMLFGAAGSRLVMARKHGTR